MVTNLGVICEKKQIVLEESGFPIRCLSSKELGMELINKETGDWKIPLISRSHRVFRGFNHFSPEHLFEREGPFVSQSLAGKSMDFLVAYDSKEQNPEEIAGVLKFGVYNNFGFLPDYWAVCYVDVREDKRGKGIATSLFRKLNNVVTPDDFLVGTQLSEMGEKYRLDKKLHQIITVCPYFDDAAAFGEYCRQNGLLREEGR